MLSMSECVCLIMKMAWFSGHFQSLIQWKKHTLAWKIKSKKDAKRVLSQFLNVISKCDFIKIQSKQLKHIANTPIWDSVNILKHWHSQTTYRNALHISLHVHVQLIRFFCNELMFQFSFCQKMFVKRNENIKYEKWHKIFSAQRTNKIEENGAREKQSDT